MATFTLKSGYWSDPTVWSTGIVPADGASMTVGHTVKFDLNMTDALYPLGYAEIEIDGGNLEFSSANPGTIRLKATSIIWSPIVIEIKYPAEANVKTGITYGPDDCYEGTYGYLESAGAGLTLKESVYKLLQDDGKLTTAGHLGHADYLAKSASSPFGVYFAYSPVDIMPSFLTYSVNGMEGPFQKLSQKNVFITVAAWGDNYEAVLKRVRDLLHDARITATDITGALIKWEWSSQELWDEDLKCYYRQDRYQVKGIWK